MSTDQATIPTSPTVAPTAPKKGAKRKAGDDRPTVKTLVRQFGMRLGDTAGARLAMGRIVAQMTERITIAEASKVLRAEYPNARAQLGRELNTSTLKDLLTIHEVFVAGGGIESPDGRWSVDGASLGALGLTTTQTRRVAEAAAAGKLPIKRLHKAANLASVTKQPEIVAETRKAILALVEDAPAPAATLDEQMAAAQKEEAAAAAALKRAQARVAKAAEAIAALRALLASTEPKMPAAVKAPRSRRPQERIAAL